jgi:hypothetical protein
MEKHFWIMSDNSDVEGIYTSGHYAQKLTMKFIIINL